MDSYGIRRVVGSKYSLEFDMACPRKADLMKMAPRQLSLSLPPKTSVKECWTRVKCVVGPLSNDIYCLTSHIREESRDHFSILSGKIALCNPSIHDFKVANPFPPDLYSLLSDNITASKPCRAHFGFGKVNNSSSSNYKVVVLLQYGKALSSSMSLVYSLRSGKWKTIVGGRKATNMVFNVQGRRIVDICYPFKLCPQRFLEGCWHWIVRCEDRSRSLHVLSFNFADEAFKLIGCPPTNPYYGLKPSVFTLHDHLAVIMCYSRLSPRVVVGVDVWMMMEYGVEDTWTRIYNINPNFSGTFSKFLGLEYHPLRDGGSDSICIESVSFSDGNEHIIRCDDAGYQVPGHRKSRITHDISTYIETLERL